jgi:hypothetical protein
MATASASIGSDLPRSRPARRASAISRVKPPGQMSAVLEGEPDVVELGRPLQQRQMAVDVGANRLLPEAPTHLIHGDDGVGSACANRRRS